MEVKKAIVSVIGGIIAAFIWYLVIGMVLNGQDIAWLFLILLTGFTYLLYKRTSRARYSAGWASVLISLGSFALPIGTFLLSSAVAKKVGEKGGAEALGAGIGAGIATGISFFIGLFFGIAFAIAAYFLLKGSGSGKAKK